MRDAREDLQAVRAEINAERDGLARRTRLVQLAEHSLEVLGERLKALPAENGGEYRECLSEMQGRIDDLRAECIESWRGRIDRLDEVLTGACGEMGRMMSLAALGELSASVAHEIRNPLCGMLLSVEVLQTKMDAGDSRTVLLDNLQREAEKMEKVVNNLLHFARHYRPRRVRCRMGDVIRRSLDSVKRHLEKKAIRVEVCCPQGQCTAEVDPDLVHQVFRNILLNSVDASPEGSHLEIQYRIDGAPGSVKVAFSDHGQGIEKDLCERIFDPFYTSKHNGVGLGLSVCRKIVQAHDGCIDVDSTPGRGARFTITFPGAGEPGGKEARACH